MLVCLFLFVFGSFLSLLCFFFFFFFGVLQVGWDGCVCCFVLFTRGWGRLEPRPLGSSLELYAFYYVASSPGSPLPHLLDGHRKLVGCSASPARSCPGPVITGPASLAEQIGPEHGCSLLFLAPSCLQRRMVSKESECVYPMRKDSTAPPNLLCRST